MKKSTKVISGVLAGVAIVGGLATAGYYVAKDIIDSIPDNSSANVQEDVKWLEAYACDEEAGQEGSLFLNKMVVLIGEENILVTFGQEKDGQITCYNEYEITNYNNNAFDHYVINKITQTETGRIYNVYLDFESVDRAIDVVITGNQLEFVDPILTKVEIPDFIDYDGRTWHRDEYYVEFLKNAGALASKYERVTFRSMKYVDNSAIFTSDLFKKSAELTGYAVMPDGSCYDYLLKINGFCESDLSDADYCFASAIENAAVFDWKQLEITLPIKNYNFLAFKGFVEADLEREINESAFNEISNSVFNSGENYCIFKNKKLYIFKGHSDSCTIIVDNINSYYHVTKFVKSGLMYNFSLADRLGDNFCSNIVIRKAGGSSIQFNFDNNLYSKINAEIDPNFNF